MLAALHPKGGPSRRKLRDAPPRPLVCGSSHGSLALLLALSFRLQAHPIENITV